MKIRSGFVSNSSSSSFVVKGFVIPSDKIDEKKLFEQCCNKFESTKELVERHKASEYYDEHETMWDAMYSLRDNGIYYADNEEDGAPKNSVLFGELIEETGSDRDWFNDHIIDCVLDEDTTELQNMVKSSLTEEVELPLKIVVGTRMC